MEIVQRQSKLSDKDAGGPDPNYTYYLQLSIILCARAIQVLTNFMVALFCSQRHSITLISLSPKHEAPAQPSYHNPISRMFPVPYNPAATDNSIALCLVQTLLHHIDGVLESQISARRAWPGIEYTVHTLLSLLRMPNQTTPEMSTEEEEEAAGIAGVKAGQGSFPLPSPCRLGIPGSMGRSLFLKGESRLTLSGSEFDL